MTSSLDIVPRPRFTIVMNVFNGEKWLHDALRSVFSQTFDDWELVFWDDQSTDGSAAVLDDFPKDRRIRYFHAPEQTPLGKARELAIREARGEWLAFLDQDDVWTPDKLEKQARVIDEWQGPNLEIVYGRAMRFGVKGTPRDFDQWHECSAMPEGDVFEDLFRYCCFICQSAVCLRTESARAVGEVPERFRYSPDLFYYAELASRGAAACTQDFVCWYRMHPSSMSLSNYNDVMVEILEVADIWKERLDPEVYRERVAIQHTLLGLRQITSLRDVVGGLETILRKGSLAYLLSRPWHRATRRFRRACHRRRQGLPEMPETLKESVGVVG